MTVASTSVPAKRRARRVLSDWNIVRDLVPDAPNGGHGTAVAELAAELPHVHVHGPRIPGERVSPYTLEELVARQHESAMVEELPEEIELLGGELHGLAADGHLAAPGVDAQVAVLERRLGRPRALLGLGRAAQDRLDPRDQLARVERLGQVVV